jgi:hypothetical protein
MASPEIEKVAAGLAWKLLGAPSVAQKWKDADCDVVRSLRFPGVFLVKLGRDLARELGIEHLQPLAPEISQAGLVDDLVSSAPDEVWVWTYRLHLNSWLGQRKQTLMLPLFQRWWFTSEYEAAFARDYRLFRDCYDVHTSLGLLPPGTRPCLPAHRVGREQSPFTGVGALPHSKTGHWRYRDSWGKSRWTGSYTAKVPGTKDPILSGFHAAGLRERSFRSAFVGGDIAEHREGGESQHKAAKPPYCNFQATIRLPGESGEDHHSWLRALELAGRGRPGPGPSSQGSVPDTEGGWEDWTRSIAAELHAEAGASMILQQRLDAAWESSAELPHPAELWRGRVPGQVESVDVLPRRESMVRMVLQDGASRA